MHLGPLTRLTAASLLASSILTSGCSSEGNGTCKPGASLSVFPHDLPGIPTGLPGTTTTGPSTATGTALEPVASFGDNPGGLAMYVHAPAALHAGAPVVVALHGCTQSASAYAGAGWNAVADAHGFLVVYAEQSPQNDATRCFRWWDAAHTSRDKGEAKSIRSMVDYARAKYGAKDAFVTGLSAGGAMTAVMLATYPDVFRAGAVMSGLPYHCASSQSEAYTCMSGKSETAAAWKALLPALAQANPPRVAIWHGSADYLVRESNAEALVLQWTAAHGIKSAPSASEKVGAATHDTFRDERGIVAVERWVVDGMSHGVALDPKKGCGTAGAYLLDVGVCSTERTAAFFGIADAGSAGSASGGGAGAAGTASATSGAQGCSE